MSGCLEGAEEVGNPDSLAAESAQQDVAFNLWVALLVGDRMRDRLARFLENIRRAF